METTRVGVPAGRRGSGAVTAAVGVAVAALAIVFAFNATDAHSTWFGVFKLVHVGGAVFWVGGGVLLTVLALRAERAGDPDEMATIARQAMFVGERLFAPVGLLVFAMGITMVINLNLSWGTFWVDAGLVGYALTFTTGLMVLAPRVRKIEALLREKGAAAPETQAAIREVLLITRVDQGVLLLVVADMLMKPFS